MSILTINILKVLQWILNTMFPVKLVLHLEVTFVVIRGIYTYIYLFIFLYIYFSGLNLSILHFPKKYHNKENNFAIVWLTVSSCGFLVFFFARKQLLLNDLQWPSRAQLKKQFQASGQGFGSFAAYQVLCVRNGTE